MKQRLAIARALLHEPPLLFLDEPTAGLDPEAAHDLRQRIREMQGGGRTIFLCTHNLEEAEELSDRVAVFRKQLCFPSRFRIRLRIISGGVLLPTTFDSGAGALGTQPGGELPQSVAICTDPPNRKKRLLVTLRDFQHQRRRIHRPGSCSVGRKRAFRVPRRTSLGGNLPGIAPFRQRTFRAGKQHEPFLSSAHRKHYGQGMAGNLLTLSTSLMVTLLPLLIVTQVTGDHLSGRLSSQRMLSSPASWETG